MRLSELSINALSVRARNRIALELNCSVPTVDRWVKENKNNGDLTKATVVRVIAEETGLLTDQILEEVNEDTLSNK